MKRKNGYCQRFVDGAFAWWKLYSPW